MSLNIQSLYLVNLHVLLNNASQANYWPNPCPALSIYGTPIPHFEYSAVTEHAAPTSIALGRFNVSPTWVKYKEDKTVSRDVLVRHDSGLTSRQKLQQQSTAARIPVLLRVAEDQV
jgi:hypothetical protein